MRAGIHKNQVTNTCLWDNPTCIFVARTGAIRRKSKNHNLRHKKEPHHDGLTSDYPHSTTERRHSKVTIHVLDHFLMLKSMVLSVVRHMQHKETFDRHNSGGDVHPLRSRAHVASSIKASFRYMKQQVRM